MKCIFTSVLILSFIGISENTLKAQTVKDPSDVVQGLHETLLEAMKNSEKLGYSGRNQLLSPVIKSTHRFKSIGRIILGSNWRRLDEDEKSKFLTVFTELSIATYASRFDSYSNEEFVITKKEFLKHDRVVIRSKLAKHNGEEFQFDYLLDKKEGDWKIINVIVDGISDLALKRAEYTSEIENNGLEGLLAKLVKKIGNYKKPS